MGVVEDLLRAREAYERRDWVAAYERLSDLDSTTLRGDDFAHLASAAFLTGRANDCVQALQRAYQVHLDGADRLAAARSALWLAQVLLLTGEFAVAGGWIARAARLLDDEQAECAERGYLDLMTMFSLVCAGELERACPYAPQVIAAGRRFGDANLLAMGLAHQGRFAVRAGRFAEGVALLDEAMLGVAAAQVSEIHAGIVYCATIEACQEVYDLHRVTQWTEALTRWCAAQPGLVTYTGQCAVHRGQIMRLHGAYAEAVEEYDFAARRYLAAGTPYPAGLAYAERGDVLRILGRFDAADEAYSSARGYGLEPQPGLALLWLERGKVATAVAAISRLLREPRDAVGRAPLLPAAVEILLAAEEFGLAVNCCDELDRLADEFGSALLRATAEYARGTAELARGDAAAAAGRLRAAARRWGDIGCPYESARCGLAMGRALRALGDEASAVAELSTARVIFADLGAQPLVRATDALLDTGAPGGLSGREVEVLRLVAAGRSNAEIAAALVLSEKTVARHLSNIFAKLDVGSRTAAAAFAFAHDLM